MLTVTSTSFYDKVQVENEEVILNGAPDLLCGQITISNEQSEKLSVRDLPIEYSAKGLLSNAAQQLRLGLRLKPNESRKETITHQVDPQTPPGVYESFILVGGTKRKLKLVVQPTVRIDLVPLDFTFQGTAPNTKHTTYLTISNNGNLPFQIPEVKHVAIMDMDYLCKATSLAIRSKGASESFAGMMDELTKNISKNMSDWLAVSIKEAGTVLAPGQKMLVELCLTLPKDADPNRDYSGEIRIWDQVVSYIIKAHNIEKTSKK